MTFMLPDGLLDEVHNLTLGCLSGEASAEDRERLGELLLDNEAARRVYLHAIRDSVSLRRWAAATELHSGEASGGCDSDTAFLRLAMAETDMSGAASSPSGGNDFEIESCETAPRTSAPNAGILFTTLPGPVGFFSSGWPAAYLIATVIFGVGALIGAFTYVSHPAPLARQSTHLPSPSGRGAGGEGVGAARPLPSIVGRITGMVDCRWQGSGIRGQGSGVRGQGSGVRTPLSRRERGRG